VNYITFQSSAQVEWHVGRVRSGWVQHQNLIKVNRPGRAWMSTAGQNTEG